MPYDPFQMADPFAIQGFQPAAAPRPQAPSPLSKEDQDSLLERIGNAGLGGLGFIGGILNKPGRIVRGLLGGKPREALNAIPFSDALGITKPEDQVSGTDLLRNAGIHNEADPSFFSPEGIAGFGVDVLTDPLTYLSFGGSALSKAGVAAKKAGTLPATIAERSAQGLGGHIGVGLPFSGNAATFDLSGVGKAIGSGVNTAASVIPGGQTALNAAQTIGGGLSDLYTKTIPPLFEGAVMGRKTKAGQDVARRITEGTPEAIAAAREQMIPLAKRAMETGFGDEAGGAALRQIGETGVGRMGAADELLSPINEANKASNAAKMELGIPGMELHPQQIKAGVGEGNDVGFLHRQASNIDQPFSQYLKSKSPGLEEEFGRKGWTEGLTTKSINDMAQEPMGTAGSTLNPAEQVKKTIEDKYLGMPKHQAEVERLQSLVQDDLVAHQGVVTNQELASQLTDAQAKTAALKSQAAEIARMKLAGTLPQFLNHPIVDAASKLAKDNVQMLKAKEIYKGVAGAATKVASEDTMPAMEALKHFWEPVNVAGESIGNAAMSTGHTAPIGAQVQMAQALGVPISELGAYHVNKEIVKDLAGLTKMHSIDGMQAFTKVWDSATNLTKAWQTMFPSTVVRNAGQDLYNKMVFGAFDATKSGPAKYLSPITDAMSLSKGEVVEGLAEKLKGVKAFAGLDDAAAAQKFRDLTSAFDIRRDSFKSRAIQDYGADLGAKSGKGLEQLLPKELSNPFSAYAGGMKEGSFRPSDFANLSGVGGKTTDVFAPVKAMRAANNSLDNVMRESSFLAFLTQGYEPAEAFKQVMKTHYDFGNLSQFEKSFMKRVVPFYSWSRQNVPAVIKEIASNPGGMLSTSVKATEAMKGEHPGFLPPQLDGVAAPIGGEENGQQRFLSRLGLGFEDLGQLAGPGGPTGMLNPLIKAPIEQLTGRQLFTGRDIRDLHSRVSDITGAPLPVGENALMNSPLGRVVSTASTLADPRKSIGDKLLNTLTGARLTDVDMEQSRRAAVRDYLTNALHGPGVRHFDEINVKPEDMGLLSPLEQQLYGLYRQQQRRPGR